MRKLAFQGTFRDDLLSTFRSHWAGLGGVSYYIDPGYVASGYVG